MNNSLLVTKRDGTRERINLDKIHRVIEWAAEGLHNVSVSKKELHSHSQFYDDIAISGESFSEAIISSVFRLIGSQQRIKTTPFIGNVHKLVDSKSLNLGKQSTTVQPEGLVLFTQLLRVLCKLARSPPCGVKPITPAIRAISCQK
ncbi:ribonucleotide-diphosphate reductase subunit alpha [Yersinia frederiksenii]|nr:ribonucleotide-diphosphate reductase subunit alpha [Yersinia frederiksenii]CNK09306.1 ribonucleotide-diphosphate reductase subunit alpha [Yersinia frederiksenii]